MPSETLYVGGQLLPLESAGANSPIHDPTIVGLLDYFGFWLRTSLSAKLSEMGGPTDSTAIADACPAAHLFPWNHGGAFMRQHQTGVGVTAAPLPGLWMWSESEEWSKEYSTIMFDAVERTVRLHWIFPQVQIPNGFDARSGLAAAAGRAIIAACSNGRHPSYGYGADAPGTSVLLSLGIQHMGFVRGQAGMMAPVPGAGANGQGRSQSEGTTQRFFPAYDATIQVVERVKVWEPDTIADAMHDNSVVISTGEVSDDTTEVLTVNLPSPADVL